MFLSDDQLRELASQSTHFSTHSGEVGEGGIFIALKGSVRDGHVFVPELLKRGIKAAIVENPMKEERAFQVTNSQEAHWKVASYFRDKFTGPVIGVGGSSGKTSTKEILYKILSKKFRTVRTDKSQNGLLGIPRTLEKLRPGVEVAIVEIGIDAPGDMARNVSLVRPTHSLLTSIGEEHLNLLKNLEGVFNEERILIDVTRKLGGKTYVPVSDPFLARLSDARQVPDRPEKINPILSVDQKDAHTLQNIALAAAVAFDLGMSPGEIASSLHDLETLDGRGRKWQLAEDLFIVRDHYNANPSSMEVALEAAKHFACSRDLEFRLMIGDMLDLGDNSGELHRKLAETVRRSGAKNILWVGPEFKAVIGNLRSGEYLLETSCDDLSPKIIQEFKKPGVVLVKGSRGTAMENVMDRVYGEYSAF